MFSNENAHWRDPPLLSPKLLSNSGIGVVQLQRLRFAIPLSLDPRRLGQCTGSLT